MHTRRLVLCCSVVAFTAAAVLSISCDVELGGLFGEQAFFVTPGEGDYVQPGTNYDISWVGIWEPVRIDFSADDGQTWTEISGGDWFDSHFNWDPTPSIVSGKCYLRVYNNWPDGKMVESKRFTLGSPGGVALTTVNSATTGFSDLLNAGVAWADYDKDGAMDIALAGENISGLDDTEIYINEGGDTFSILTTPIAAVQGRNCVAWVDLDSDGDPDLTTSGKSGAASVFKIYRNNGDSTFTDVTASAAPTVTALQNEAFAWGDYDSDGDPDLVYTGVSTVTGLVTTDFYRNTGGVLAQDTAIDDDIVSFGHQVSDGAVLWADLNWDNRPDLILVGKNSVGNPSMSVYMNQQPWGAMERDNGTINGSYEGLCYASLAWGDLSNDNTPDLAVMGARNPNPPYDPVLKVLSWNWGPQELQVVTTAAGAAKGALAWGDCDNDGRFDLAFAGCRDDDADKIAGVYLSRNGSPALAFSPTGVSNADLAWADHDGDLDLDLVVAGEDQDGFPITTLYRNDSSSSNDRPYAPDRVWALPRPEGVMFGWWDGWDNETSNQGLTYNLGVVDPGPPATYVMSPLAADPGTGELMCLVPSIGNVGFDRRIVLRDLAPGTYNYAVQTVDTSFQGSNWSPGGATVNVNPQMIYPGATITVGDVFYGGQNLWIRWQPDCLGGNVDIYLIEEFTGTPHQVRWGSMNDGSDFIPLNNSYPQNVRVLVTRAGDMSVQATPSAYFTVVPYADFAPNDGLHDAWQSYYGVFNPPGDDDDGDSATNLDEFLWRSDPVSSWDTDNDTVNDNLEINFLGTDPTRADTDGDQWLDNADPSPFDPDADYDGMPDGWENLYGLNTSGWDSDNDDDNDGWPNIMEYLAGTEPNNAGSHP